MITLELCFSYDDARTAGAVFTAVDPENKGFVDADLEGNTVIFRMEAESAATLRNTADDLLACIKAAEGSAGLVSEPYREPEERPERYDVQESADDFMQPAQKEQH